MRKILRLVLPALLGLGASFALACGDRNGLLSSQDASALSSDLEIVRSAVAAHRCDAARAAVVRAQDRVRVLPRQVDRALRRNLARNLVTLERRASTQCRRRRRRVVTTTAPTLTTESVPTTTATPTTTAPTTQTTTTTPTTQTTTTSTPTSPSTSTTAPGGTTTSGGGRGRRRGGKLGAGSRP